jgi:hypothetical protein
MLAKEFIEQHHPQKLSEFVGAFEILRTDPGFRVKKLPDLFHGNQRQVMHDLIQGLKKAEIEKHEIFRFGRTVFHNHEFFNSLQKSITDQISDAVNESVEPCYNFLSLYNNLGVCRAHLDAPSAKWTVDYCIEQSAQWPIHLSRVRPWPEDWTHDGNDWELAVKNDPANQFTSFELQEGQAIVFGGSSQWHYRDRIEQKSKLNFCHLVFFHFIPRGTRDLTKPAKWADLFGIPELSDIIGDPKSENMA